jgi:hypothetical protein
MTEDEEESSNRGLHEARMHIPFLKHYRMRRDRPFVLTNLHELRTATELSLHRLHARWRAQER